MMNIMNPPADWSTLKKLIWLRGSPINGGEDLTVSGTPPLSLPNSLGKPLKAWSVDLLPYQDLHGYANPWPAGGGKNLVNYLACVGLGTRSNDDSVFYATTAVDGILTFTGEASYVHGGMIYKGIGAPTPPTSFTVSAEVKSTSTKIIFGIGAYEGGGTSDVNANFTVTANTWVKISRTYSNVSYGKIGVFLQPQQDADVLQVKNVQVESGTTATDYTPYSNICPINGTDKVTVVTAGNNLLPPFAGKTVSGLTVTANADGSLTIRGKASASGVMIGDTVTLIEPIPANTTVTFSTKNNVPVTLRILVNPSGAGDIPANGNYVSFTRPNAITGARLYIYTTIDAEYDFTIYPQLELGSTPSEYTPYIVPSQTVLTLPQTVYTGTVGSDGGESAWGEVDLGTLTWFYYADVDFMYAYPPDIKSATRNALCEMFPWGGSTYQNPTFTVNGLILRVYNTGYTDPADFKTFVTGCKFVYETDTPTAFAVPSVTIPTPRGTATAWATAEDGTVESMDVTYVGKA